MKRSERDEWVAALRSGDFPQAPKALRIALGDGKWGYCCLGVKCELDVRAERHGARYANSVHSSYAVGLDEISETMPTSGFLRAWGLSYDLAVDLATRNDHGVSFDRIATWIEENVPVDDD